MPLTMTDVNGFECAVRLPALPTNTGTRSPSRPVASPAVDPPAAGEVSGSHKPPGSSRGVIEPGPTSGQPLPSG